MAKLPSAKKVEDAVDALHSVRRDWLKRTGVTAVDVGFKYSNGEMTDQLALRLHVERKLPAAAVAEHEMVGDKKSDKIKGFETDVIEATYAAADAPVGTLAAETVNRRDRIDPMVGGISCGNPRITAGTLGAIVFDRATGAACILSNWHVLCGDPACQPGEDIWQPGRADGGTSADTVATLLRSELSNRADAALARLNGNRNSSRDILELDPVSRAETPSLGMLVAKSGRTTGLTKGIIDGVSLSTSINYGSTVQAFTNQIRIVPRPPWPAVDDEISRGGDSGSVWINEATGAAIGLHFAGETSASITAEHAVANRMVDVMEALNFQFTPRFVIRRPFDDLLRDRIRLLLCQRFPQLCAPQPRLPFPFPFPRPLPDPGPQAVASNAAMGCNCSQAQIQDAMSVDDMVDDIMAMVREQN